MTQVIVVGGGLAGMSAAHTVLEQGGRVVVIDKSPFCGGNSTKATSGINAAGSRTQRVLKIPDAPEVFEQDTAVSAAEGARPDLIKTLTHESGPAVDWLMDAFGLDLTIVARLAAHSYPRTHRGKERFPGMMITYGLMEKLEQIADAEKISNPKNPKARVINKAEVNKLITEGDKVIGVEYIKGGKTFKEYGPVIIATGGFGADFSDNSLLAEVSEDWLKLEAWSPTSRACSQSPGQKMNAPNLRSLATTNGPHCTGDGIKLALSVGADTADLECVQVHPTGLVDPAEPDAKVKFLAAEALRGSGGIILDRDGNRFCDELGKRDYVTGRMWLQDKAPYRLVLNSKATKLIDWHCEHYCGRGLMHPATGEQLCKEMGIPKSKLKETFDIYNEEAKHPGTNKWGKKFFEAMPAVVDDDFMVAEICPVVHYCMGGVLGDSGGCVIKKDGNPVPGLYVAGEALGGVHGVNRLGGSSLLDCVVYGRVSGRSASKHLMDNLINNNAGVGGGVSGHGPALNVRVTPGSKQVSLDISWDGSAAPSSSVDAASPAQDEEKASFEDDPNAAFYGQGTNTASAPAAAAPAGYTVEEVAKHTTDKDCWVMLDGDVYDVTDFLDDHPGGKKAIMLYAGKDATKEFEMLHKPEILTKYAAEYKLGPVAGTPKL